MNYLLFGNSYRLLGEEIKRIVNGKTYETFFAGDVEIESIIDDLSYDSLFSNERILVIKDAEIILKRSKDDKGLELLLRYLEHPNWNNTLIFISSEKIAGRAKIHKDIISKFKVIDTPILNKGYEVANYFSNVIRTNGYIISQSTLNDFVSKCSDNLDICLNEFEKLKLIFGPGLISNDVVEKYICNYNTNDIFGFKDAVLNKEYTKARSMLNEFESSKIEGVALVIMLGKEYSTLYDVKYLKEKKYSNEVISKELGMHPFRVKNLSIISSKYTLKEIENIICKLAKLNIKMVSMDNLGIGELKVFLLDL